MMGNTGVRSDFWIRRQDYDADCLHLSLTKNRGDRKQKQKPCYKSQDLFLRDTIISSRPHFPKVLPVGDQVLNMRACAGTCHIQTLTPPHSWPPQTYGHLILQNAFSLPSKVLKILQMQYYSKDTDKMLNITCSIRDFSVDSQLASPAFLGGHTAFLTSPISQWIYCNLGFTFTNSCIPLQIQAGNLTLIYGTWSQELS